MNIEDAINELNYLVKISNVDSHTFEDFEDFHKEYLFELNNLRLKKEDIEKDNNEFNLEWLNEIKKLNKINSITKNVIDEFIDNIFVKEDGSINIEFKFKEPYKETIEYLKTKKL